MLDGYLKYIYKLTFYFLICLYVLAACDTTDCITFNTRFVIVDFLDSATGDSKNRQFDLISAQESQVIFYSDTSLNTYYLPVNTELEQTVFLFLNPDQTIDTLEVSYDKTETLISKDCGYDLEFKNLGIIQTTFDSAVSLENELSRLNEENIKIFF
jgi:hypothetical protein